MLTPGAMRVLPTKLFGANRPESNPLRRNEIMKRSGQSHRARENFSRLQPEYLGVTHDGEETSLIHYRLGRGERRLLILAGIHGREHGGIQVALELLAHLQEAPLNGQIDILPVCNPMAFAAETRFTPENNRDMARAFSTNQPENMTEALCHTIMGFAEQAEVVLNLHSAGDARYLPHVIFYRDADIEKAASMGFPFAIKRGTPESLANHIFSRLRPDQFTATLELGGGTFSISEDVILSVNLIKDYLARIGFIVSANPLRDPTSSERIWKHDLRQFVRAPNEGAFYSHAHLGTDFALGQAFGQWMGLEDPRMRPITAPAAGMLIYLRTRNRVPQGETLAMFLPPQRLDNKERSKKDEPSSKKQSS
jgi:predicted deacylase